MISPIARLRRRCRGLLLKWTEWSGAALLGAALASASSSALRAQEYSEESVKAVFLFHFSRFVQWPPESFARTEGRFIIGLLGRPTFEDQLEEAIKNETIGGRPIVLQRCDTVEQAEQCQIVFVTPANATFRTLRALRSRPILTVSDARRFVERGGAVQFDRDGARVRLRINREVARENGLFISSKLLRLAEIFPPEPPAP